MSIERDPSDLSHFILICDSCGEEADEPFDTFQEAVNFKKDKKNGWRSVRIYGWEDHGPCCPAEPEKQEEKPVEVDLGAVLQNNPQLLDGKS